MEGEGIKLSSINIHVLTLVATYRSLDDPYFGISTSVFPQKIQDVLLSPINEQDVEIKPDGRHGSVCLLD